MPELMHVAPFTEPESRLVEALALTRADNAEPDTRAGFTEDELDQACYEQLVHEIAVGEMVFSRNRGLHAHRNPGSTDPYFVCLQCYGD